MAATTLEYPSVFSLQWADPASGKRARSGLAGPPPSPKRFRPAPQVRKREREDPDAMQVEGAAPGKRARHQSPCASDGVPAATVFPWSRQAAWRDLVDAIPTSEPWGRRIVADLDREGPDVPVVTARELRVLLQRAHDEGTARGRRTAEQHLESQRQNLVRMFQQQQLQQRGVLPACTDYRASYIQ